MAASGLAAIALIAAAFALARWRRSLPKAHGAIVARMREGIIVLDAGGRVTHVNPAAAEMLRTEANQALGRPGREVFPEVIELAERMSDGTDAELSVGTGATQRIYDVRVGSLVEPGAGSGQLIVLHEITAAKRAELSLLLARDEALAAARSKADFLATMSHEIRTPMNGVVGATEILLGTKLDSDQRDLANTVRSSAEALVVIIDSVLDFSKIESGRVELEQTSFGLEMLLEEIVGLYGPRARHQGLDLVTSCGAMPPTLWGDAGRLRQVLTNLIANALKFTEKGSITVHAEREVRDDAAVWVRLSVNDTGIGIDAAQQARLFEPFVQADGSMSRRYGGTGLGLAICKRLVELMGGEISLRSQVGHGSSFTVTLPFEAVQATTIAVPARPSLRGQAALIFDARSATRRSLEGQLGSWGATVETAEQAGQAIAILRVAARQRRGFSWLFADLGDAGEEILRVLRTVRAEPALRQIRVLLLYDTAQTQQVEQLRREHLVDAALSKPLRDSRLRESLTALAGLIQGTTPPAPPKPAAPMPLAAAISSESRSSRARILVVEDNTVNQKVALRMLANLGHAADVAADGQAGVEALAAGSYDLVLMDCQMPVMDGFAATSAIRAREAGGSPRVAIVAMTANAMESDRERCLESGMDDYLAKPVRHEALNAILTRWLPKASEAQVA